MPYQATFASFGLIRHSPVSPSTGCPLAPYEHPHPPVEGVRIDRVAPYPPVSESAFNRCLQVNHLTVCPATSPAYSILFLKVTVPGGATPVIVSIGLAGNGNVARTILYSLKAA